MVGEPRFSEPRWVKFFKTGQCFIADLRAVDVQSGDFRKPAGVREEGQGFIIGPHGAIEMADSVALANGFKLLQRQGVLVAKVEDDDSAAVGPYDPAAARVAGLVVQVVADARLATVLHQLHFVGDAFDRVAEVKFHGRRSARARRQEDRQHKKARDK